MESYTRNFKIPLYLFVIEAIVTLEKFTSLASFSVEGGKSSWCSKSFCTEWNSTVIVTSPRIGNLLASNYKFQPQRQRMLWNFGSDFPPFLAELVQSDDTRSLFILPRA